jgi:putative SOS response-associated peptidase YedK
MCGRYRLARKKEILAETFDVDNDVEWGGALAFPPGAMSHHRVSTRVNSVKNDDPRCAEEFIPTLLF